MMGDGSLSQDEINALLMGASDTQNEEARFSPEALESVTQLIAPLANEISIILKAMTDNDASVFMQPVVVNDKATLLGSFNEKVIDALTNFSEGLICNHHYIIDASDAAKLNKELTGQSQDEAAEVVATTAIAEFLSSLAEVTARSISSKLATNVVAGLVNAQFMEAGLIRLPAEEFVVVPFTITIHDEEITLYTVLDPILVDALFSPDNNKSEDQQIISNEHNHSFQSTAQETTGSRVMMSQPTPVVQGVSLPNLVNGSAPQETKNIGLLMDVMMEVTVELGRTRQPIKDILSIGEGTIIELDKLAGEPVDILVNHNRIAKGEVVVIDENFGVRITEILSGADKLNDR